MKELKATDLRIGNYVYNTEGKIDTVGIEAMKYIVAYGGTKICQVKPIELTEEWLLRFGFKKTPSGMMFILQDDHKTFAIESDSISFSTRLIIDYYCEIKYVHELQNIYFALTGQELEVKF